MNTCQAYTGLYRPDTPLLFLARAGATQADMTDSTSDDYHYGASSPESDIEPRSTAAAAAPSDSVGSIQSTSRGLQQRPPIMRSIAIAFMDLVSIHLASDHGLDSDHGLILPQHNAYFMFRRALEHDFIGWGDIPQLVREHSRKTDCSLEWFVYWHAEEKPRWRLFVPGAVPPLAVHISLRITCKESVMENHVPARDHFTRDKRGDASHIPPPRNANVGTRGVKRAALTEISPARDRRVRRV